MSILLYCDTSFDRDRALADLAAIEFERDMRKIVERVKRRFIMAWCSKCDGIELHLRAGDYTAKCCECLSPRDYPWEFMTGDK